MSEDHFRLVYDGSAVEDGEMEIGQLAPSLLAFGKLVEALDVLVSGEGGRVRVLVRADVRRGSFDIGLSLDFLHSVKAWFMTPEGAAWGGLLGILGINVAGFAKGLIQAVRWLRSRPISQKTVLEDGNVQLVSNDGDSLIVLAPVAHAIDDASIRHHLERFTQPLREEGLSQIRFETEQGVGERISAQDAAAFLASAGSDPTSSARFRATYQIRRLYFERGKKWRLSSGSQTILAGIEDDAFWLRVEAAEVAFSADDYLICDVRMEQWLGFGSGLRTEYAVERVVQHIPAPKQDRFPGT